jgi:peptidoglycan/LPS O-acetylase OafA/YrhL
MHSNLDVLRAYAVLLVFAAHASASLGFQTILGADIHRLGRFGVLLFFVHTCLVLMMSLERHRETALHFYFRRAFRIFPLSIAFVVLTIFLRVPSGPETSTFIAPSIREVVSNLLLVQNLTYDRSILGVLWSLPLELNMYLLLPAVFLLAKRGSKVIAALWIASVCLALIQPFTHGMSRLEVLRFAPNFLPGVLAFTLKRNPVLPAWAWMPFLLALTAAFSFIGDDYAGWILCLALGLAIPHFHASTRFIWLPAEIAKYSYGIYLSHIAVLWFCFHVLPFGWLLFVPLAIAVPIASYHLIEHPMIQLASGFQHRDRVLRPVLSLFSQSEPRTTPHISVPKRTSHQILCD